MTLRGMSSAGPYSMTRARRSGRGCDSSVVTTPTILPVATSAVTRVSRGGIAAGSSAFSREFQRKGDEQDRDHCRTCRKGTLMLRWWPSRMVTCVATRASGPSVAGLRQSSDCSSGMATTS